MQRERMSKHLSPLARHRMARGLTQKKLAAIMDVRPSTVCAWEQGKYRPEADRIPELANHLGIEPIKVAELLA
jgi:transcriptional regulator with XRE-family HTH domain